MHLGVVIVSYNVRDLLAACLTSLAADLSRAPHLHTTAIVVDNASADGSAAMVEAYMAQTALATPSLQLDLIASAENLGFARGNNVALRKLGFGIPNPPPDRPEAILLLNPDTELHPGAMAAMTDFLIHHPQAGGCGAHLNYGDGSFQHSAFMFPGLTQLFLDLFPLHPRLLESRLNGRYPRRLYNNGQPFPIDFALGAALMVRDRAIDAAGLLDEDYFMYAEEMDWCRRLQAAGWPLYCVPNARITHHEGRSTRQFRAVMLVALWRSRLRYYDKYYSPWQRNLARWLLRLSMRVHSSQTRAIPDLHERQARLEAYRAISRLATH